MEIFKEESRARRTCLRALPPQRRDAGRQDEAWELPDDGLESTHEGLVQMRVAAVVLIVLMAMALGVAGRAQHIAPVTTGVPNAARTAFWSPSPSPFGITP